MPLDIKNRAWVIVWIQGIVIHPAYIKINLILESYHSCFDIILLVGYCILHCNCELIALNRISKFIYKIFKFTWIFKYCVCIHINFSFRASCHYFTFLFIINSSCIIGQFVKNTKFMIIFIATCNRTTRVRKCFFKSCFFGIS